MAVRESLSVLAIRDFRLALIARLFDSLAIQIQAVAVGWQIFQMTRDPLPLGLIGLAEGLPYMGVALWAGHLADRLDKQRIIASAEAGIGLAAVGFLGLSFLDRPPLGPIYFLLGWGGVCRSFQWAAVTAYVQLVVPRELYPRASAWNSSAWHAAAIAGPAIGGLVYGAFGRVAAYGTAAAFFLVALGFVTRMRRLPAVAGEESGGLAGLLSGLRFVFKQRVILAAMSLDMFAVLFGGVVGIMPIFADLLGAGPEGLGFLKAAPAVGALAASLYLTHAHPLRRTGQVFMASVAAFGISMIAFALSRNFWLSLAILAVGGAVDAVSMVFRPSIYQVLTPDPLRGRVAAVNGVFIRTSNEIGAFESGLAAKLLGVVPSVIFGGCVTLLTVAAAVWKAPQLRRFQLSDHGTGAS